MISQQNAVQTCKFAANRLQRQDQKTTQARGNVFAECEELYGTVPYAPPEVLRSFADAGGDKICSTAVDVWSLACFMFQLLTCSNLFGEDEDSDTTTHTARRTHPLAQPMLPGPPCRLRQAAATLQHLLQLVNLTAHWLRQLLQRCCQHYPGRHMAKGMLLAVISFSQMAVTFPFHQTAVWSWSLLLLDTGCLPPLTRQPKSGSLLTRSRACG